MTREHVTTLTPFVELFEVNWGDNEKDSPKFISGDF